MKKLYQLLLDRWNQKTDTVLVTIVEEMVLFRELQGLIW